MKILCLIDNNEGISKYNIALYNANLINKFAKVILAAIYLRFISEF